MDDTEETIYQRMTALMEQLVEIAERERIPFVAAYEHDGLLQIKTAHRDECSEIWCAYGELGGWWE